MEAVTNMTAETVTKVCFVEPMSPGKIALFIFIYVFGILGNLGAMVYLFGTEGSSRNPRHTLLLKCLAVNDLTAVAGMLHLMALRNISCTLAQSRWYCGARVVWRTFGLGSGCIVCVMAIDRWIALTRPFFYQKYITPGTLKKSVLCIWLVNMVLVLLPLFGYGVYYDEKTGCKRYKEATTPKDWAYAYVYLSFGSLLWIILVICNLMVMKALVVRKTNCKKKVLVRRISRNRDLTATSSTQEELAFAKVMGLLCAVFTMCWLPILFSIPFSQSHPVFSKQLFKISDIAMGLHFVLDPYFYVLQRWSWFTGLFRRKPCSRGESVKTTQELISL